VFRRIAIADGRSRAALADLVATPRFELIPLKSATGQAGFLPPGSTVSVTVSTAKGLEATIDLASALERAGHHAVPHLAARQVRDTAHLRELLSRLADAGIQRAFVVGGDAAEPGAFPDGLSLLRAMADTGHGPTEIGIACYPQGHAFIPDDRLLQALAAKAPYASYMTTQMCFDAKAIGGWLAARRADGIALPAILGIPGVTEPRKLLAISARIGVRDSRTFIARNLGLVKRLVRSGGFYRPTGLLGSLAPYLADTRLDIRGLHLYTFNQVEATEAWRRRFLEEIGARPSA
jgi:methylenetetrahydrofolate reductase (NADPH)